MKEPEKGLSSCGTSEILDGSLEYGKDVIVNVKGGEDLKSVGVGGETEARLEDSRVVESEEGRIENAEVELDSVVSEGEVRDQVVVGSDSSTVVESTPGNIEVPTTGDAVRAPNTSCDNALGGENAQCKYEEKENQKDRDVVDHGTPEDGNDVTLEALEEQKNISSEACICDKVESEEKLNSNGEQPIGKDKVDDNSNNVQEVVSGTEVEIDKTVLNSDEKQSPILEKCNAKEQIIAGKDVGSVSALDVSDAEQFDVQGTGKSQPTNHTAEIKGTSVSIGSEENLNANAIVGKETQITDKGSLVPMRDGKEKLNNESNTRKNFKERECISEQVVSNGGQEIKKGFNESRLRKRKDGKVVKAGSSEIVHQAQYSLPIEKKEGEFALSDMVWGKVRSHPWWPGQIFDPSDASERAMKHYKKDCYFVAYFGDRTFAWNEASQLKHFRAHFSTIEKQRSSSESFQNAIDCALDEVTRRVEYGLACSCIPKDTYDTIKCQTVENTGIQQDITFRHVADESLNANSFSPTKLLDYVKTLSEFPTGGFDSLELVIAKAQLLAFYRFNKGFSSLPEIQHCGGFDKDNSFVDDEQDASEVVEHATPVENKDDKAGLGNLKNQSNSRQKRKYNKLKETKKERRLSELVSGTPDSPDGDCWSDEKVTDDLVSAEHSKKRRAIDHYDDDSEMQDGRKTISVAKVSNTTKSSFKIGDGIRRAASQLTGSPSILKCSTELTQKTDGDDGFPENGSDVSLPTAEDDQSTAEYSSLNDLLSSLQWVAQEPLGDYTFLNAIVSFFSDFRNSVVVTTDSWEEILRTDKFGTKRKKPSIAGIRSPETFEFEDMSDTYWTDRVIDNGKEEKPVQQPPRKYQKKDKQLVSADSAKPAQVNRRSYTKKKNPDTNHAETPEKPPGYIDENAPAELVMNFAELNSVPSEANLNRMFKRFGPLKESETEVDRVSSRARVVFKKCVDAEVAFSSAKKFNIFGSVLVNYQLNYTPSAFFKAPPVTATQDQEMLLDLSNFEVNMV